METSCLLCISIYFQIRQGTNHIVIVTPVDWVLRMTINQKRKESNFQTGIQTVMLNLTGKKKYYLHAKETAPNY
jgi:hypothetical protein